MALPKIATPTRDVELSDGQVVTVRSLTRGETLKLHAIAEKSEEDGGVFLIACATGNDESEVRDWMDTTPAGDVNTLAIACASVSGMDLEGPKE